MVSKKYTKKMNIAKESTNGMPVWKCLDMAVFEDSTTHYGEGDGRDGRNQFVPCPVAQVKGHRSHSQKC